MSCTINASTTTGLIETADLSGSLQLQTNSGTTAVTIDTSQNVGIGTASPSRKLTVYATGNSVPAVITNDQSQSRICFKDSVTALDYTVGIGSIGENLASYTGGTERMRIDSSGNLLVGTTSQVNGSLVNFSTTSDISVLGVQNTNASHTGQTLMVQASRNTTNASFQAITYYNTGASAYKFYVIDSGAIYSTSTSITSISDQRFKENIQDIDVGLTQIMALKPRRFDWKDGKGENRKNAVGFIAQEVQTILPDLVTNFEISENDKTEYFGLRSQDLIPTLVKAIQELNAKVDALEAKVGI